MTSTNETRVFVPMATFIGSLLIGHVSGQAFPNAYGFVFGVVFAFGFWLSIYLSRQTADTFPLAVFLSINQCLYWMLLSWEGYRAFLHHYGVDTRIFSCVLSAICSCLATVVTVHRIRDRLSQ